ncbi:MAG: hypothetical protein PF513_02130 [Tenericutes bacterium]|jgi:hypothetical protein|nr:hypothetical protein [Mycoplasmatota bacterium]
MENNKLEVLVKIIFFGALWGVIEATLGYVLHFLPMLISGTLMFPIVIFVLYRAYKSIGSRKAIFYVGMIAIMIKSTNLLLPMLPAAKTINPMISMFLQSLLVFAVIPMLESDNNIAKVSGVMITSVGWRLGVMGYLVMNYYATGFLSFRLESFESIFTFTAIDGFLSGLLAIALVVGLSKLKSINKIDRIQIHPLVSAVTLVLAVVFTLIKF